MRLLDTKKMVLCDYDDLKRQRGGQDIPYAILSHRWLDNEVTFGDMPFFEKLRTDAKSPKYDSVKKIERACQESCSKGYDFVWLDTCCIDQKNPVEISTAVNSMYRWYKNASKCFAYLRDYDSTKKSSNFKDSEWFERGWTLQELVAPAFVEFFDGNWKSAGNKVSRKDDLFNKTGIDRKIGRAHV